MKNFLFTFICFLCTALASAQPADLKPKLDSLLSFLGRSDKFMGSVSVSKANDIIYQGYVGSSTVTQDGASNKIMQSTLFRIGGVTKIFTATMIHQLVEEGKLKYNTTIEKFFPSIPYAKKITVAMLLRQRSGLFDYSKDSTFRNWAYENNPPSKLIEVIAKQSPFFSPNEKTQYSNSNYLLLGFIIEQVTSNPYSLELDKRIVQKLQLKNTKFASGKDSLNEAYSYKVSKGKWVQDKDIDPSVIAGGGGVISTSHDLNKFIGGLFGGKLVNESSLKKMQAIEDDYGLGLTELIFKNDKLLGDIGLTSSYIAGVCHYVKNDLSIAFCSNALNLSSNDFVIPILSIVFNESYKLPSYNINLSEEEVKSMEGKYSCITAPDVTMTIKRGKFNLQGQLAGQTPFPLHIESKTKFYYDPFGVVVEFQRKNFLTFSQNGNVLTFIKEK